jgi:hypothetical protein
LLCVRCISKLTCVVRTGHIHASCQGSIQRSCMLPVALQICISIASSARGA